MEIIALPDNAGVGALDDTVRALFQLQSRALKAAQAQIDELRRGSHDAAGDARVVPPPRQVLYES